MTPPAFDGSGLRRPPPAPPEGFRRLRIPGAPTDGGELTGRQVRAIQADLRQRWNRIVGSLPERTPLEPRLLEEVEYPDHQRTRWRYRVTPSEEVEAFLLLPRARAGRLPGMVVLHQTSSTTLLDPAGMAGRESVHLALHLVRRGYACVAPVNFLWGDPNSTFQQVTENVLARWQSGMARMVWDSIRAADFLAARPEVDSRRIGSIGHSLGGKEALYHAAFDPRIRAAVSCEGGVGLDFSNWDAPWYLGSGINSPAFDADNHEVIALTAPRGFLLIGGESADGARSWPYIGVNQPLWRAWNAEERLGLLLHPHGHNFPPPGKYRDLAYGWLAQNMK